MHKSADRDLASRRQRPLTVELLYIDGCPTWRSLDRTLRALAKDRGFTFARRRVTRRDRVDRIGFRGSPTILVDGDDAFARGDEPFAFACRLYDTPHGPAGAPTLEQLVQVLDARAGTTAVDRRLTGRDGS